MKPLYFVWRLKLKQKYLQIVFIGRWVHVNPLNVKDSVLI